jgi:hypothetical protein
MGTEIFAPDYYRVFERVVGGWRLKVGKFFYKKLSVDFDDFELLYGISKQQVAVELFRINGGKAGYYLANLRSKKYYYCGYKPEAVGDTLKRLGIGRDDPIVDI